MFTLNKILVLLCVVLQCMCETQVFKNELSEEVKTIAIGIAEREILLKHRDSIVAQTLSNDFGLIYGGKWLSYVGLREYIEGIIPSINAAPNTTLWFAYNTTHVLLFKPNQCETSSSIWTYMDVIYSALDYNITYNYTDYKNSSLENAILVIIKDAIKAEVAINCHTLSDDFWSNSDNCYYNLAVRISRELRVKHGDYKWTTIVGKAGAAAITEPYLDNVYQVVFNRILEILLFSYQHLVQ